MSQEMNQPPYDWANETDGDPPPDPDQTLWNPHLSQRDKEQAISDWIVWKLNEARN